ncbi:MAG: tetratricopeptide repeat protein [Nitrospirota bacterium]
MEEKIYNLIRKAEQLRERSVYREALQYFKKALLLSRKHHHLDGIIDATLASADIYRITGNFDLAIKNYEEALESCEALGNSLTAADCMVGIGLSLRAIGMWKESLKFIETAKKTYRKVNDKKGLAFSLWAEAGAQRVAGNITVAINGFKEAKRMFTALSFNSGIAYALCGLGGTHRIAGKYKESLDYYRRANALFASLKDTFGSAYSHCGIGNAYRMLGNYREAMNHFRKATRLYESIGDLVSYSYTLWSVAMVHKMNGDFARARRAVGKAMRNFRKTKDPRGIIYCDMALGEMLLLEGKKRAAEKKLRTASANADRHRFRLEQCHATVLLSALTSGRGSLNERCYKKIGIHLPDISLPFNIP